jgi:flagellar basal-body rod protein FlgB
MAMTDLPILSMLRSRMHWQQERQRVLAENVANSDTPGFRPSDLKELDLRRVTPAGVTLAQSNPMHFAAVGGGDGRFQVERDSKNDVRPAGNAVSLEDEMMKVAQNQMDYQAASMLYSRSLNLLKTALGKR